MEAIEAERSSAMKTLLRVTAIGNMAMLAAGVILAAGAAERAGWIEAPWLPGPGTALALFTAGYCSTAGLKALACLAGVALPRDSS